MDTVCPALRALTFVTPSKFVAPLMVSTSGLVTNDMNGGKFEIAKDCARDGLHRAGGAREPQANAVRGKCLIPSRCRARSSDDVHHHILAIYKIGFTRKIAW